MIYKFELILNKALTYTELKIIRDIRNINKFGVYDYVPIAKVSREDATFARAVIGTISELEYAIHGIKVEKIASPELVSLPQIAEITKLTRQTIHNLATGRYGPGGWPTPIHTASGTKHHLWRFTDIAEWWSTYRPGKDIDPEREHIIGAINARLRYRHELAKLPPDVAKDIKRAQKANDQWI